MRSLCRGVEGDVLDFLCSASLSETGSAIARRVNRSKSEVWKALRFLVSEGIVTEMRDEGGTWYSLRSSSPLTPILRSLPDARHVLASRLVNLIADWSPLPLSAVIATSDWARVMGLGTCIIVVTTPGQDNTDDVRRLQDELKRTCGPDSGVLAADPVSTLSTLNELDINASALAQSPLLIMGMPLHDALAWRKNTPGGTGGI